VLKFVQRRQNLRNAITAASDDVRSSLSEEICFQFLCEGVRDCCHAGQFGTNKQATKIN